MPENQPYEEKELLLRVAAGDQPAFGQLFEKYRRKIFYIANKVLRSEAIAEDVLQEIFLVVWREREKLPAIRQFSSWLNTLTRNYVLNRLRRQSQELLYVADTLYRQEKAALLTTDAADWNELHRLLLSAVRNLPVQQGKVFELARFDNLSQDEIAARLGISKNTVKRHMAEAMKNIYRYFEDHGHDLSTLLVLLWIHP